MRITVLVWRSDNWSVREGMKWQDAQNSQRTIIPEFRMKVPTSLVVQWLRICLAMQGSWVRSLVRELRTHMLWDNQAHRIQNLPAARKDPTCATQNEAPRVRMVRDQAAPPAGEAWSLNHWTTGKPLSCSVTFMCSAPRCAIDWSNTVHAPLPSCAWPPPSLHVE